jgi:undecaprenyl-diphosphatase
MSSLHVAVVAIVQSISEVVPVGAEPHLPLLSLLADWPEPGPAVFLAIELGTLAAIAAYLVFDVAGMVAGLWRNLRGRRDPRSLLLLQVLLGTVPLAVAAYLVRNHAGDALSGLAILAWSNVGFAVLLAFGDGVGMTVRRIEHLQASDAIVIGIAQAASLIPGAGRAALAMTAARVLGFERPDAARFSLLLALPALTGSCAAGAWELHQAGATLLSADAAVAGAIAFVVVLLVIACLMAWLKRHSFTPFVVYRLLLGAALLGLLYGWY